MKTLFYSILMTTFLTSCLIPGDKSKLKFSEVITTVISPVETKEDDDKTFTSLQKRVFNVSCIGCHSPKKPKRLDLTKKENIIENFQDIIDRMRDSSGVDTMPPFEDQSIYPAVSEELILELEAWKNSLEVNSPKPEAPSDSTPEETTETPTENTDEPWL